MSLLATIPMCVGEVWVCYVLYEKQANKKWQMIFVWQNNVTEFGTKRDLLISSIPTCLKKQFATWNIDALSCSHQILFFR